VTHLASDDWTLHAACRTMGDALFPDAKDQAQTKKICFGCPVCADCLAEALDNRIEWGIWGGMTERERRQLLRLRPDVKSWRVVLGSGKLAKEQARLHPELLRRAVQGLH